MKLVKKILLLLNIVVIILTLLSYLTPYIDPSKFWFFSFFGLLFPAIILSNILFVILWFFVDRKRLLLSLIVLLIGYNDIKKIIAFHFNDFDKEKGFTVLSYNMNQGSRLYHQKVKKGDFGNYIKQQSADLVLGQEINSKLIKKEIAGTNSYPYKHVEKNLGTGIYSKFPIVNTGKIDFQLNTNSCVWADIVVDKDTIRAYSVHFMSNQISKQTADIAKDFGNEEDLDTKKVKVVLSRYKKYVQVRARQVKKVRKHILTSPYPVVLGGDFNDPSISYTYQQLSGVLKDAFIEKGYGMGISYAGAIPLLRIDNILVSKQLTVLAFKKINGEFSDHYAIKAKLKL